MKAEPLVTILINNYNYGDFVADAIESALNQTYPNIEVIVVDDGSTDNSKEVIMSYGNKIIPILQENGGQASAFNSGFAASQGEIICLLDSDDLFVPEKVKEVVDQFQADPSIGWIYHPQKLVDSDKNEIPESKLDDQPDSSKTYDFRPYIKRGKLNNYLPSIGLQATSAFCFQRSLLNKILPMPESIRIVSDNYVKYLALGLNKGFVISKFLSIQRIHDKNAFTQKSDNKKKLTTARIDILTAYWIRKNFPELYNFANNIFAGGLQQYWKLGGIEPQYQKTIDEYFTTVKFKEKMLISLKFVYYYVTW